MPGVTYYVKAYATNKTGTGYGVAISFTTENTVLDIDGNVYHAVGIGSQIWMVENLMTTKYNDGTDIPLVTDNSEWSATSTPAYCYYNNDNNYGPAYGVLYNWYAASSANLCPEGWHVPTNEEWTALTDYLGGLTLASFKLKEAGNVHWNDPNGESTNESGFTAVAGGYRSWTDGNFFGLKDNCSIWSSTSNDVSNSWSRVMINYNTTDMLVISNYNGYGISVRCMKNQ
jgi:uncharacterized protein (TIGR02145 family)